MPVALVVDDSRAMRQLVAFTLTSLGFHSEQAENGNAGLKLARSQQFDVVISDVNMPEMGGMEFVRELRLLDGYSSVPVLMLTTEFTAVRKAEARQSGASGWIIKPFDPDQLRKALDQLGVVVEKDA